MKEKRLVQFCPNCGSKNIQMAKDILPGDSVILGKTRWSCLECGYSSATFPIATEEEYKQIPLKKNSKR